jgi:type II secretory pathway predicted ATPase ExeA
MYEHFFQFFGLRENPFHTSPDPRFFYSASVHESALTELTMGVDTQQGVIVLIGEAGTGKTVLLQHLLNWLRARQQSSCYIYQSQLKPLELFGAILDDFGVRCESRRKVDILTALKKWLVQRHSMGDSPVLIIDEAQAIPLRTLDRLRMLLNLEVPGRKLLQIVLAGQPGLDDKLRRSELRPLHQRIMFRCTVLSLSEEETAEYVKWRMAKAGAKTTEVFPDETLKAVYRYAKGIPRVVNLLCEHALIEACAERQKIITLDMIGRAAILFELTTLSAAPSMQDSLPHFRRLVPLRADEKTTPVPSETALAAEQEIDLKRPSLAEMGAQETKPEQRPKSPTLTTPEPILLAAAAAAGSLAIAGMPKPQIALSPSIVQTDPKLPELQASKPVASYELPIDRNRPRMGDRFVHDRRQHFRRFVPLRADEKTTPVPPETTLAAEQKIDLKRPSPAEMGVQETEAEQGPKSPTLTTPEPILLAAGAAGSSAKPGTPKPLVASSPIIAQANPKLPGRPASKRAASHELPADQDRPALGDRFARYLRGMEQSFVRDWRQFLQACAPAKKASGPESPRT